MASNSHTRRFSLNYILRVKLFTDMKEENHMKTYKVSADIRPYLRRNLLRGCYSCRFFRDEKGILRCKTNASSETFHKMIVFSRSDRDSEKYGIKYVPYNKINMELILNETPAYVVEKVAECYL